MIINDILLKVPTKNIKECIFDIIDQIEKKHSNKIEFRNVMRHYGPYSFIEILKWFTMSWCKSMKDWKILKLSYGISKYILFFFQIKLRALLSIFTKIKGMWTT